MINTGGKNNTASVFVTQSNTGGGGTGVVVFNTLDDVEAAYPEGVAFPVWVVEDGCWYYWNGTVSGDVTAPVITASIPAGTYSSAQTVTLSSNESGTIFYTLDGSTPTTGSSVYSAPLTISSNTTLKFFGRDTAGNSSAVQSIAYVITVSDTTPPVITASPSAGTFTSAQSVTLSANETASIYYTLDGSTPTVSSTLYTTPIVISTTKTLKFFGRDSAGNNSTVQTLTYTISIDVTPPNPVTTLAAVSPSSNSVPLSWTVSSSTDVVSQEVAYSTNGTTYTVYGSLLSSVANSVTVTGLTASTAYTFRVVAIDGAGNRSTATTTTATTTSGTVAATGVSLNKSTASLEEGLTLQLVATVAPSSASNKAVTWSSNNTAIATVNSTGLVTAVGDGTATITVTTVDGGFTATCLMTITQAIIGFDYNNLVAYADDSVVTFDQVVNGEIDFVHPSVLYFPDGWNGWKYWMGVNPYPNTQGFWENPFFFHSNNGTTWTTPAGITQPIFPKESDVGNNSDAHIFMDYDGVTMHYLNRGAFAGGGSMTEIFTTTDGVTFSARQRIYSSPAFPDLVAPSMCLVGGKYYIFATDVTDQAHITVLEASNVYGPYTEINRISTGVMGNLWHCEVRYINQEFIVLASTGYISGGNLMLGKFFSVMDSTVVGRNVTFITPPDTQSWNRAIYKSSFVMKSQTDIEIFVGFKGSAVDANTDWRISKVPAQILPQTLDLSTYTEVASYTNNSAFSASPGKSTVMDHQRYAVDFTLSTVDNFNLVAFADTTNELANVFINTDKILINELWNVVGGTKTKKLSYGLSAGDRVTMMVDNEYRLYINGRLVYENNNIPNVFDNLGTAFGDRNSTVSMSNIKVYKKDAYIYSQAKADAYKAALLAEYATTPSNFILVDEFNRANGAVGTSNNGVVYEVVGTPVIEGNALKPSGSANAILVPVTGNYSISFKLTSSLGAFFGVYLKYTDSNNYIKFVPEDTDPLKFRIITREAGIETVTKVPNHVTFDTHRNYRLDVISSVLYIYEDTVFMNSMPIPVKAFNNKVGFTSGFAATTYDHVIIKKLS